MHWAVKGSAYCLMSWSQSTHLSTAVLLKCNKIFLWNINYFQWTRWWWSFCLFVFQNFLKMRSLVKKSAMRAIYLKGNNTLALKNLLHWNQYETHFLLSSAAKYTGFLIFLMKRSHWWWLVISGDEWSLDPSGFSANC